MEFRLHFEQTGSLNTKEEEEEDEEEQEREEEKHGALRYCRGLFDLTLNVAGLRENGEPDLPAHSPSTNIKAALVLSQRRRRRCVVFIDAFDLRKLKARSRD